MANPIYPSEYLALVSELERETSRIIDEHCARSAKEGTSLQHMQPFQVSVKNADGTVATFWEEGISFEETAD